MKLIVRYFLFFSCTLFLNQSQAQTIYFSEDFNSGQPTGYVANGYNGWTVTTPTANGLFANEWFVTCAENGNPTGTCGSGCGNDATLHIGNVQGSPLSIFCPFGDCGAAYDAGLFTGEVVTDRRAESPIIDLTCAINPVSISFRYFENGEGATDNFTLDYFDGLVWAQIDDPAKTIANCAGQGRWTFYSFNLPASAAGNPNVQIGFRWVNDDNGNGTDPSVAIDSVRITTPQIPLNPDFTISPNANPCVGDCINFIDQSTGNIASWDWDFGGGGTPNTFSGQSPPAICWNTSGVFDVTLTVSDICGNHFSQIQQVTVTNCSGLIANFSTPDTTICVGTCIDFTDLSSPAASITSWNWIFFGATPSNSNLQNPTNICFNTVGSYDVKLTISDGINITGILMSSYITVSNCQNPIADFSTLNTNGCINDCFTFTDQSQNSTTWGWGFPGGTPNFYIGQNPPQICYSTAGVYDVAQYVADANGNTDTLVQVGYITISNCPPPVAGFNTPITTGCVNDCFTFTDQSQNATTWGWGFPGGTPNFFIGQNPPQICYLVAGTYDVAQYVSDLNGNTDTLNQIGYISISNCTAPTSLFNSDLTTGCQNTCVTFSDQSIGATSWTWSFTGGTPSSYIGQTPPLICFQNPGIYDVQLIVSNAFGIDTLFQAGLITINLCGLNAQFSASDSIICEGDCITFYNESIGQGFPPGCKWIIPGAQPDSSTSSTPTICFMNPGDYAVTLIAFDSIAADTVTYSSFIHVSSGTPVITNIDSITIYSGQSIQLNASGGVSFIWYQNSPYNSLDNDSISAPIATPFDTTVYQVIMTDANGCSSAKTVIINVIPPEFVWAPTAFTPNKDLINDVFTLKVSGIITNYNLKIFDRWGEMIFTSNDPLQGWDGTYQSVNLNVGVYIYYYRIEFIDGIMIEKAGDITLLK